MPSFPDPPKPPAYWEMTGEQKIRAIALQLAVRQPRRVGWDLYEVADEHAAYIAGGDHPNTPR